MMVETPILRLIDPTSRRPKSQACGLLLPRSTFTLASPGSTRPPGLFCHMNIHARASEHGGIVYYIPKADTQCARDEGRPIGVKELALRKALAEEGLLDHDDAHYAAPKRIDGRLRRVLWLPRSAVEKAWRSSVGQW